MTVSVLALAGGVGGAKLALGLSRVLPPERLTIVVNTGDDEEFYGLHVSPDLDTVMYTLASLVNTDTGWGVAGDSFNALEALKAYGVPAWFNLGDRDLATHLRRSELLREGHTLSQVTETLCCTLGIRHRVVPMSDDRVRTIVETDEGDLPFQVYFVKRRCEPVVGGLRYEGAEDAMPSPHFKAVLKDPELLGVVLCPSNPFLSIAPILAVSGVREQLATMQGTRVVVSPIVGGEALRGPAAKIMGELGHEVSCVGVAKQYVGLCDIFVIDDVDKEHAEAIAALGMRPEVCPTVMVSEEDKIRLARHIFGLLGG